MREVFGQQAAEEMGEICFDSGERYRRALGEGSQRGGWDVVEDTFGEHRLERGHVVG